jgi:hypothetical protein
MCRGLPLSLVRMRLRTASACRATTAASASLDSSSATSVATIRSPANTASLTGVVRDAAATAVAAPPPKPPAGAAAAVLGGLAPGMAPSSVKRARAGALKPVCRTGAALTAGLSCGLGDRWSGAGGAVATPPYACGGERGDIGVP